MKNKIDKLIEEFTKKRCKLHMNFIDEEKELILWFDKELKRLRGDLK